MGSEIVGDDGYECFGNCLFQFLFLLKQILVVEFMLKFLWDVILLSL